MCGRFTLRTPQSRLVEQLMLMPLDDLTVAPRYNIAPTQPIAVVRTIDGEGRLLSLIRWGLIPFWAKDPAIGNRLINARAETVAEKPAFRQAFRQRRCLIPADGYYEWRRCDKAKKVKQPYFIHRKDDQVFAFAGLWERWQTPDGHTIESAAIITTEANELTRSIHERMPAILAADCHDTWLSQQPVARSILTELLRPFPSAPLEAIPVSRLVNSPTNDGPDCIAPIDQPLC